MSKLTWNCTEWVCNSVWSGATSAKMTFTFAYVSSPRPVYPMINSTCMQSRTKGNGLMHLSRRGRKNIDQRNLRTHLFYYIKTGTVMFTWYWPIRLRSDSDLKQNTHVTKGFFSLRNSLDLCRWDCTQERNFCLNQVRLVTLVFAQKPTRKSDTCSISTTGICDRMKSMLDSALQFLPGITYK